MLSQQILEESLTYYSSISDTLIVDELEINKSSRIEKLRDVFRFFPTDICYVLGAGISMPFQLPSWNQLLNSLFLITYNDKIKKNGVLLAEELFNELQGLSTLRIGRFLQNHLADDFIPKMHELLYENFTDISVRVTLDYVIDMITKGGKKNADSVITYNYDSLLEDRCKKNSHSDIIGPVHNGNFLESFDDKIPVYHVHGYLPKDCELKPPFAELTLGDHIYHDQYSKIYSWQNLTQIEKFREKTCLFIGISFTDPNLRRLLDVVKDIRNLEKRHYILLKRSSAEDFIDSFDKKFHKVNGYKCDELKLSSSCAVLSVIYNEIIERDLDSFGIDVLWHDDYNEFAETLSHVSQI